MVRRTFNNNDLTDDRYDKCCTHAAVNRLQCGIGAYTTLFTGQTHDRQTNTGVAEKNRQQGTCAA